MIHSRTVISSSVIFKNQNQKYAGVSRKIHCTKSPPLCLHARTTSSKTTLPRYPAGHLLWKTRRTKASTRNLLIRFLCHQVCVCHQFKCQIIHLWNAHSDVFCLSWRRLWRPVVWPDGSSNLWLRRRCDTFSFPEVWCSSLSIRDNKFFRLFSHTEADDEISFNPRDIITNIEMIDEGWWRGQCHGRTGLFPAAYVQLLQWATCSWGGGSLLHSLMYLWLFIKNRSRKALREQHKPPPRIHSSITCKTCSASGYVWHGRIAKIWLCLAQASVWMYVTRFMMCVFTWPHLSLRTVWQC